ncbi:MAG: hypothetical protein VB071_04550 [Lawsonibacter sp.]|nr:hypothetical protein [Lawsonibacter sp.]
MGFAHQFLLPELQPIRADMKLAGWACTGLEYGVFASQKKPFGYLTEALNQLKPNGVYITTGAHNSTLRGELLTATA